MPDLSLELKYPGKIIAGIDEVGRGPLAGPVVAAAVIIDQGNIIDGIRDSKKLSLKKREALNLLIRENYQYSIGEASVEEIDKYNILEATKLAMRRAMDALKPSPEVILVDGNMKFEEGNINSIIKGDDISLSIAAASIIAKVYRDSLIKKYSEKYPYYGWEKNAGYGTKAHIEAIKQYGITPLHRKKFVSKIHF